MDERSLIPMLDAIVRNPNVYRGVQDVARQARKVLGGLRYEYIGRLYAEADDHEADVLDDLSRRAGITWDCHACGTDGLGVPGWTNGEFDDVCDHCGTPRPEEENDAPSNPA